MTQFSHLHVHTRYSLLDGAASIEQLYAKAAKDNMPALAITDHGNMFGVFDFVRQGWNSTKIVGKDENGNDIKEPTIKPIVGSEFYVVRDRFEKTFTKEHRDKRYHQVLLAKNMTGYKNMIKLSSKGFVEGFYSKYPRIDKELLQKYHEGIIATTCCLGGYVPQTILKEGELAGEKEFQWWLNLFGDDYYVELQRHNMPEQQQVNEVLLRFAKKYNVPYIATNDSHYTEKDDANAHDILLCINTGAKQETPGFDDYVEDEVQMKNRRFKFPNDQFYFKTTNEMSELFGDLPQALDNTNQIVDKVESLKLTKDILLPAFPVPKEYQIHEDDSLNQWEYLKALTYDGAIERYGEISEEVRERIEFELFTIKTMGFSGYFLIVRDFHQAGHKLGVFIGPGRGSAAGSVVAYCLGITNIDPIKYKLLFERFLNPQRKSMPDIDTDFDDEGRQRVIDYVVEKYGKAQVAQIVTFGTMAAKMSIKDVARVLDLPLSESNALAKLVPDKPGTVLNRVIKAPIRISDAKPGQKSLEEKEGYGPEEIENIKHLREIYQGTDIHARVLQEAVRLEGCVRSTGLHAAGIIIAPKDLMDIVPVCTSKDAKLWVTQIEGSSIESAGVIKMDFLGLKTLSILKTALRLIAQNHNIAIDLNNLPLDDKETYDLYQRGETNGTFQFESVGMQKYLRELKPDKFDDLIAMNALYRPGPISYIPNFIARKQGREEIVYDLPEMEEYLSETYGITVYQEQVMLLAQKLGGFSKGDADILRKAMGKKKKAILDKMKIQFMDGATKKGFPKDKLEKIWTDWEAFAQYAFNKSHSTGYAYVAYQTGYLKAHYPSEYMAAVLNHAGNIEKITFFMEECKRMGINVLGPDVLESEMGFSVNKKGEIRFGLGGIKGVGEAAVQSLISERTANGPYANIFDLIKRINQRTVNKKALECLAYSGAFDCFPDFHRAQYFFVSPDDHTSGLEKIITYGQRAQAVEQDMSNTLFGALPQVMNIQEPKLPNCDPWPLTEKLSHEKDVTGMFISGHPLDHFKFELKHYGILQISDFNEIKNSNDAELLKKMGKKSIKVAGLVTDAQHRVTKNGKNYGSFVIEDFTGKSDFFLWSEDYMKFKHFLEKDQNIVLNGFFKQRYGRENEYEFKITSINLLETIKQTMTSKVELSLQPSAVNREFVDFVVNNVNNHPGKASLSFNLIEPARKIKISLHNFQKGFELNDDMVTFLDKNPEVQVQVSIAS